MAEVPRVVPQATGLVSARYCRSPRRLRGLRQPLAGRAPATAAPEALRARDPRRGPRRGSPRRARAGRSGSSSGTGRRPMAFAAGSGPVPAATPGPSRRSSASRYHKRRPRRPAPQGPGPGPPAADPAGHPARRGRHPAVAPTRPGRDCGSGPGFSTPRACVFEDESGFYLLPGVVRTYAPGGADAPVLREEQTRDHLSVMGAMTPAGRVYTLVRQEVAQRAALHRVPPAPAPGGGGAVAGGHGTDRRSTGGRRSSSSYRARARPGLAGGPAGLCPRPESLG